MAHAWFVSDIHITDMQDEKAGKFLAFLSSLGNERPCSHLFLVGDIFDLWVGDHHYFIERFEPLVQQLQRLVLTNVEVHYFEGNHDLHLLRYFEEKLGISVHEGPEYFELDGQVIRVEHGDESDPDDKGYLFLRWFLRTPLLKFLSYHLPGAAVSAIGERASAKSRDYTTHSKTIDEDEARRKLHAHADKAHSHRVFDVLIYGHVHLRDDHKTEAYRAINLGTWLKQPGALRLNGQHWEWAEL